MTKLAVMSIYGKTPSKISRAYDFEIRFVALGPFEPITVCSNDAIQVDIDLFYSKVGLVCIPI